MLVNEAKWSSLLSVLFWCWTVFDCCLWIRSTYVLISSRAFVITWPCCHTYLCPYLCAVLMHRDMGFYLLYVCGETMHSCLECEHAYSLAHCVRICMSALQSPSRGRYGQNLPFQLWIWLGLNHHPSRRMEHKHQDYSSLKPRWWNKPPPTLVLFMYC